MSKVRQSWLVPALLAITLLIGACGASQSGSVTKGDATQGRSLWPNSGCAGCHGVNAQGSTGGPALADTPLTLVETTSIVRRGGPGMPKYSESQISDQDLRDLYAWFQNPVQVVSGELEQDPWTGSPCAGCHGISARGGTGPGLAGTLQPFATFQVVVRQGAEGMPAYGTSQISATDLQRMYDWLEAQAEVPATEESLWVQVGCGGCHGANAGGGSAPALTGQAYAYGEFQRVVREGEEGMPAYGTSQISDTDLRRMYDWLGVQAEVPAAQELAWTQMGCGGCHGANAEGGIATPLAGEAYAYDEFQRVVREGEEGMPAYSASQISDTDLRRMYDWLMALP